MEHFRRDLLDAFGNGPAVLWFEGNRFEDEEVQRALNEIAWLTHIADDLQYTRNCR